MVVLVNLADVDGPDALSRGLSATRAIDRGQGQTELVLVLWSGFGVGSVFLGRDFLDQGIMIHIYCKRDNAEK